MPAAVTRQRRAVRAATFGTVLTLSAVLAHALAGGMAPGRAVVTGSLAVLCAGGWLLSGRDRSPWVLAAAAVAGQAALHLTFSLAMPGSMTLQSMLCGHPASPLPTLAPLHVVSPGPSATSHQMLLMLAAHAVGGVVVLLALRSAEGLLAAIAAVLGAALIWAMPALGVPAVRRVRLVHRVARLSAATLLVASPRRGPPVPAAS